MEYRNGRKYSLLIAAAVLGSVLSAAPAEAVLAPSHVTNAAAACFWRHDPGHWDWVNGHRRWVPARSVWVCAAGRR
ncbi:MULTISPECIES: hypothetical protein [unclassified Pseudofrankia]|uniref:hypothetical protein n=1 Tax=unclassified Pseudofrankia TaxID=2994372 RepID=UPI0009F6C097|nr:MULTISPECIES: hypothetical protein [unclassified Pseudofrankia]MDT3444584.1 hypothetical protein [Pseudofrankia sp. BMG5.37]